MGEVDNKNDNSVGLVKIGEDVMIDVDEQIIMKTAKIHVKSPKTSRWENLMALLDT